MRILSFGRKAKAIKPNLLVINTLHKTKQNKTKQQLENY